MQQQPHRQYLQRHHYTTSNGGGAVPNSIKRPKPPQSPLFIPPGHVAIRLLCHVSRVGGLIGKAGSIIRRLQEETSAKIRVEDSPNSAGSNSDVHRVILIIAPTSITKKITLYPNEEESEVSSVQEAVVRVFERVIEVAAESDNVAAVAVAVDGLVSCRLLVEKGQVGSVIGKGGKTIEMMKKDTGCKIKVLNNEKLPACSWPNDEMVELEGDIVAVKKGLIAVSRCLQDCPPINKARMNGSRPYEIVQQEALFDPRLDLPLQRSSIAQPMPTSSTSYPTGGQSVFLEGDRVPAMETKTSVKEVVFNILCPNDRVGGVIGKGGFIVKALQNETGASISVGPSVADCVERLITISAVENPESQYSPAQNAVVLVFSRLVAAAVEKELDSCSKGSHASARLVVQSNEVGCLLGKGGTIISEMRKVTGAGLRIIGGDQVPKCATGNVEVLQITGAFVNVQNALYSVTRRLRDNLLPSKMPNGAGSRSGSSSFTENSPYGVVRGPPLGLHPSLGDSHDFDQHSALAESMDQLRLKLNKNLPPSPKLWTAQTLPGANQRSVVDVGRGLTSYKGCVEIGSGSRSAIVTNTTVEIVVPDNVISSIYGENGGNLSCLRQISGAKVIVHEPLPGSTDRTVVISGTPDQTQAAQSLLQAFILTGSL